jgi:hypothetical protein
MEERDRCYSFILSRTPHTLPLPVSLYLPIKNSITGMYWHVTWRSLIRVLRVHGRADVVPGLLRDAATPAGRALRLLTHQVTLLFSLLYLSTSTIWYFYHG